MSCIWCCMHRACILCNSCRQLCQELRLTLVDKDDVRDCFEAFVAKQLARDVDWNALSYQVSRSASSTSYIPAPASHSKRLPCRGTLG